MAGGFPTQGLTQGSGALNWCEAMGVRPKSRVCVCVCVCVSVSVCVCVCVCVCCNFSGAELEVMHLR